MLSIHVLLYIKQGFNVLYARVHVYNCKNVEKKRVFSNLALIDFQQK